MPLDVRDMPSRYQRTATAASGRFGAVPPGDYALYAREEYLPTAEQEEAYLEKFKDKGTERAQSASTTELHVIQRESVPR